MSSICVHSKMARSHKRPVTRPRNFLLVVLLIVITEHGYQALPPLTINQSFNFKPLVFTTMKPQNVFPELKPPFLGRMTTEGELTEHFKPFPDTAIPKTFDNDQISSINQSDTSTPGLWGVLSSTKHETPPFLMTSDEVGWTPFLMTTEWPGSDVLYSESSEISVHFKCFGQNFSCHDRCSGHQTRREMFLKLEDQDEVLLGCIDKCIELHQPQEQDEECHGMDIHDRRLLDFLFQFIDECQTTEPTQGSGQMIENSDLRFCMHQMVEEHIRGNLSLISRSKNHEVKTCRNRCGEVSNYPCSCNKRCMVNGNCCPDFAENCPDVRDKAGEISSQFPMSVETECSFTGYRMIFRCGTYYEPGNYLYDKLELSPQEKVDTLIRNIRHIPYTDSVTGISYINKYIFNCNTNHTLSKGVPWKYNIALEDFDFKSDSLNDIAAAMSLRCQYYAPTTSVDSCPFMMNDGCPMSYYDVGSALLCLLAPEYFVTLDEPGTNGRIVYKNKYCAICADGWNVKTYLYIEGKQDTDIACVSLPISTAELFTDAKPFNSSLYPVSLTLSGSRMEIENLTPAKDAQSKWLRLQCRNTVQPPSSTELEIDNGNLVCETSELECGSGMELRYDICKYDTRTLFSFQIGENLFTGLANDAILQLWQCFVQKCLFTDAGKSSYRFVQGRERERSHVSEIQIFVKDKNEFNGFFQSEYTKSGVSYLTSQLKKYMKSSHSQKLQHSFEEKITPYCFGHYYISDQEFPNETHVQCFEDHLKMSGKFQNTRNIDQCLMELKKTLDNDRSNSIGLNTSLSMIMTLMIIFMIYFQ